MRKPKLLFWLVLLSLLVSLVLIGLGALYIKVKISNRSSGQVCSAETVTVIVNPGEGLAAVARKLKDQGVIGDERLFILIAKLRGDDTRVRKGEYQFMKGTPMREVLQSLILGRQKYYKLKAVEGFNIWQIAEQIDLNRIWSPQHFLALCQDPVFIRQLGIPADSLEGYLFPDTYQFLRFDREELIIKTMVRRFEESWTPEFEGRARELGMSRHQIVTIASIIEKETGFGDERSLVSAVIYNRLKKNMGLYMDPTVIYGLMPNFDGNLTRSDLEKWTPYNTYKNLGLPPGPICNPGDDSLRAALWPASVPYLYFVAKGDGSHFFSSHYADHLKAVEQFQRPGQPPEPESGGTAAPGPNPEP